MIRRRSPHGECGLKSEEIDVKLGQSESLPAWGVWIEINCFFLLCEMCEVAPRMGSVD